MALVQLCLAPVYKQGDQDGHKLFQSYSKKSLMAQITLEGIVFKSIKQKLLIMIFIGSSSKIINSKRHNFDHLDINSTYY